VPSLFELNETSRKIRHRPRHRSGIENGARAGQSRVAGALDRLREFDSKNRVALLVAEKNRIGRGGFAGLENAEIKTGRAGKIDPRQASLRHAGISGSASDRGQQKISRLARCELQLKFLRRPDLL
jgi:hypothetical protein